MKLYVNLFCRDIEAQLAFYAALLGVPEAVHSRSAIYRAIETPGFQFGFHAPRAYGLLGLGDRASERHDGPVDCYATFMLDEASQVDAVAQRVAGLGGRVVQGPYPTYYGEWQLVLQDPEGHVFRVSTVGLPAGVERPVLAA